VNNPQYTADRTVQACRLAPQLLRHNCQACSSTKGKQAEVFRRWQINWRQAGSRQLHACTSQHLMAIIIRFSMIINNSMHQSPAGEASSSSACQEICSILWNPKVLHRAHNGPPPVPTLNSVHALPSYLLRIQANVTVQEAQWPNLQATNPGGGAPPPPVQWLYFLKVLISWQQFDWKPVSKHFSAHCSTTPKEHCRIPGFVQLYCW